jgi:hypothetical protein
MFRRARTRFRLGLLVVGCLLFQQVAVAAHACELARMPAAPAPAMAHCSEMGMAPAAPDAPVLCGKHCAPDQSPVSDATTLGVPASALPPALAIVSTAPAVQVTQHQDVPISRSDPPPRLRYCSLLI